MCQLTLDWLDRNLVNVQVQSEKILFMNIIRRIVKSRLS